MNVLCDRHHDELYETLSQLFKTRLGANFYTPVGVEWHQEGFWYLHATPKPHPDTVKQYLKVYSPPDVEEAPGVWRSLRCTFYPANTHLGVELAAAKGLRWDILIASIPEHFYAYSRFAREFCPSARVIFQQGNNWHIPSGVQHVLNSTTMPLPAGVHGIHYHPEYHHEWLELDCVPAPKTVVSVQSFHPAQSKQVFYEVEKLLPDWTFLEHGNLNRDGVISDPRQEAMVISRNSFLWHWKPCGEGYGSVLHRAFECGHPVLCNYGGLKSCTAGEVLEEGVNCLELVGKSPEHVAASLLAMQAYYPRWSQAMRQKFLQVVDWDAEAAKLKQFIAEVLG